MALNFILVVNDGGELKTLTDVEIITAMQGILIRTDIEKVVDEALNRVLDARAEAAGDYDPSDNDTPIVVTMGEPS